MPEDAGNRSQENDMQNSRNETSPFQPGNLVENAVPGSNGGSILTETIENAVRQASNPDTSRGGPSDPNLHASSSPKYAYTKAPTLSPISIDARDLEAKGKSQEVLKAIRDLEYGVQSPGCASSSTGKEQLEQVTWQTRKKFRRKQELKWDFIP